MKKLILTLFSCLCMMTGAEAQTTVPAYRPYTRTQTPRPVADTFFENGDIYYGFRLGTSIASLGSTSEQIRASSSRVGMDIGAVIGFGLIDESPLFLETGLFYMQKGGKGSYILFDGPEPVRTEAKYTAGYIELPVVCKYIYSADDELTIQPFAGVFLGMGTDGKMKFRNPKEARPVFSPAFDNGDDYLRRWDVGLKLGCGFGYDVLYAEVFYDLGIANICHDEYDTAHSRAFCINIGVNF